jgi:uncharacterized protein YoaH (UPF0181 family)
VAVDRVDEGDSARPSGSAPDSRPGILGRAELDGSGEIPARTRTDAPAGWTDVSAEAAADAPARSRTDAPATRTDPPAKVPADTPARSRTDAPVKAAAAGPAETAREAEYERQAIARRLHRVLVDHVYGVARDAWAQAVPDLRAAWENHKQRYPERARPAAETTADGSWVAGPHRRLSPEQNAEASKACADIADEGRRDILPALRHVESAEPDRRLAGLEHMLKGEDRLKEKIADELLAPGISVGEALGKVSDAIRYTFTYAPQRYADGVRADVERLKAEGFELIKLKNLWADEQYKGINSQWRRLETGLRVEVQFHTPESLEAKELTHGAYERIRGSVTPAEREELESFQRRANELLAIPEDTAEIKDYPEKKND